MIAEKTTSFFSDWNQAFSSRATFYCFQEGAHTPNQPKNPPPQTACFRKLPVFLEIAKPLCRSPNQSSGVSPARYKAARIRTVFRNDHHRFGQRFQNSPLRSGNNPNLAVGGATEQTTPIALKREVVPPTLMGRDNGANNITVGLALPLFVRPSAQNRSHDAGH